MTNNNTDKLAHLADEFLCALEVPADEESTNPLAVKLTQSLTGEEVQDVNDKTVGALMCALEDDQEGVNQITLSVAEIFSKAAKRVSAEDEVAAAVSVSLTDAKTESELVAANAPVFAAIVGKARSSAPKA